MFLPGMVLIRKIYWISWLGNRTDDVTLSQVKTSFATASEKTTTTTSRPILFFGAFAARHQLCHRDRELPFEMMQTNVLQRSRDITSLELGC